MKKTSIAALRGNLSSLLEYVQKGKELQIEKRNIAIARIVPMEVPQANRTKLGVGAGSVEFIGDVIKPAMDDNDWEMHR